MNVQEIYGQISALSKLGLNEIGALLAELTSIEPSHDSAVKGVAAMIRFFEITDACEFSSINLQTFINLATESVVELPSLYKRNQIELLVLYYHLLISPLQRAPQIRRNFGWRVKASVLLKNCDDEIDAFIFQNKRALDAAQLSYRALYQATEDDYDSYSAYDKDILVTTAARFGGDYLSAIHRHKYSWTKYNLDIPGYILVDNLEHLCNPDHGGRIHGLNCGKISRDQTQAAVNKKVAIVKGEFVTLDPVRPKSEDVSVFTLPESVHILNFLSRHYPKAATVTSLKHIPLEYTRLFKNGAALGTVPSPKIVSYFTASAQERDDKVISLLEEQRNTSEKCVLILESTLKADLWMSKLLSHQFEKPFQLTDKLDLGQRIEGLARFLIQGKCAILSKADLLGLSLDTIELGMEIDLCRNLSVTAKAELRAALSEAKGQKITAIIPQLSLDLPADETFASAFLGNQSHEVVVFIDTSSFLGEIPLDIAESMQRFIERFRPWIHGLDRYAVKLAFKRRGLRGFSRMFWKSMEDWPLDSIVLSVTTCAILLELWNLKLPFKILFNKNFELQDYIEMSAETQKLFHETQDLILRNYQDRSNLDPEFLSVTTNRRLQGIAAKALMDEMVRWWPEAYKVLLNSQDTYSKRAVEKRYGEFLRKEIKTRNDQFLKLAEDLREAFRKRPESKLVKI